MILVFSIGLLCVVLNLNVDAQEVIKREIVQPVKVNSKQEPTVKKMQKVGVTTTVKSAPRDNKLATPAKNEVNTSASLKDQLEQLKVLIKLAEANPETYSKAYLEKYKHSLVLIEKRLKNIQTLEN